MRAVVYDQYGPPDVLRFEEVEKPSPKDDEVLIKIHASTVNRLDCHTREANRRSGLAVTLLSRLVSGLRRPRQPILGFRSVTASVMVDACCAGGPKSETIALTEPGIWRMSVKPSNSMLGLRPTTPENYLECSGFGGQREREWVHRRQRAADRSGEPTHAHLHHRQ